MSKMTPLDLYSETLPNNKNPQTPETVKKRFNHLLNAQLGDSFVSDNRANREEDDEGDEEGDANAQYSDKER